MKEKLKISIVAGSLIALAGTILMLVLLALNLLGPESVQNDNLMYGGTILFIALYIFLLIGIFIALKKTKKLNNGTLTFTEALKIGCYTSLATGLVGVVFTVIFYELIYPSYNQEMVEVIVSKMKGLDLTSEQIQQKVTEQTKYYSTSVQAKFSFIGNFITGIVFSLLLGLFLRTKRVK